MYFDHHLFRIFSTLKSCKFQNPSQIFLPLKGVDFKFEKIAHLIFFEKANFGLWGDITSDENRVHPPCHLKSPFGVPPSLPFCDDIIYGWSLWTTMLRVEE